MTATMRREAERTRVRGRAPRPGISAALFASIVIACGKGDPKPEATAGGPTGRADRVADTDVGGRPAPSPTPRGPFADLSATLVEKSGILPIGYFEIAAPGGEVRQCMGGYVGKGRFVTAGHCFRGGAGLPACPKDLRISWLKAGAQLEVSSPDRTGCLEVVARKDDATGIDFALVKLVGAGTWPADALRFASSAGALGRRVKFAGPQGAGANLLIRTFTGFILEMRTNDLISNANHKPGYSGAPVFVETSDGITPIDASAEAIGIHLGSLGSSSRQLKGEVVLELLK